MRGWHGCPTKDCGEVTLPGFSYCFAHAGSERGAYADVVAAFKRGVAFRETTNAPVPSDVDIIAKVKEVQS